MRWEHLTGWQLAEAKKQTGGVCLLPIGSLEKHGTHMPTGTDTLTVHALCIAAAEREQAVVLPPLYYTHVKEMKNNMGAISLDSPLLMQLVETICDEAARNGFRKIILVNGHGGNSFWLPLLIQDLGDGDKSYAVYQFKGGVGRGMDHLRDSDVPEGHAGEIEASVGLHLFPDQMHMEMLPAEPGVANPSPPVSSYTPVEWVTMYPDAYAGDGAPASADKGAIAFEAAVTDLAAAIKAIKADEDTWQQMQAFSQTKRDPQ